MLLAYGHAEIEWQGEKYRLAPTFANIAKLGTPIEIVELFKSFSNTDIVWYKFTAAINILNACSDKYIPNELVGYVEFDDDQDRFIYHHPCHGLPMLDDVITLANHCLLHGIIGKIDKKIDGEPMTEFDAYAFIELARVHLDMSRDEAAGLTMTEFVRMMNVKFPPKKEEGLSVEENDEMLAWFKEQNRAH